MTKFKIGYDRLSRDFDEDTIFDSYYLDYERTILERTFETQVMPKNLFLMSFFGNPTVDDENDEKIKEVFESYGIFFGRPDSKKLLPIDNQFAHLIDSIEVDENSFYENLVYKSQELPTLTFNVTDDVMRTFGNFYRKYLGLWLNDNLSLKSVIVKSTTSQSERTVDTIYAFGYEEFELIKLLAINLEGKIISQSSTIREKFSKDIAEDGKKINEKIDEFNSKYDLSKYDNDDFLKSKMKTAAFVDYGGFPYEVIEMELVYELVTAIKTHYPLVYTTDGIDANVAGDNKDFFQKVSVAKTLSDLKTAYESHGNVKNYTQAKELLNSVIELFKAKFKWESDGSKYEDFYNKLLNYKTPDRTETKLEDVVTISEIKRSTPYLNLSITQYAYDSETSVVKTRPVVTYTFYNLRPNFDLKKLPKNLLQIGDGFSYENTTKSEKYEFNFSGVSMYDYASNKDVLTLGNCLKES